MARILVRVGDEEFEGELTEDTAPQTVQKILDVLPLEATTNTWGEEIYFEIPVEMGEENSKETVSKGDLGYWPSGSAFCIFYGITPMSQNEQDIVPASPVNPIGRIENAEALKKHGAGETIHVSLAE